MRMSEDKFNKDYRDIIKDVVFAHQKKHGKGITITELHKGVYRHYDVTRYVTGHRAKLMDGESLIEVKVRGMKAFIMTDEAFAQQEAREPSLIGSGYGVEKERERVDRDIILSIRELMRYNHGLHSKTILGSNQNAIYLVGVKFTKLMQVFSKKKGNGSIKSSSVRGRCDSLIRKGKLLKGDRIQGGVSGLVVKDYYLEMNRRTHARFG